MQFIGYFNVIFLDNFYKIYCFDKKLSEKVTLF
nr:hypothetical protein [Mucilaginibacter sp. X4EP1]